MIVTPTDALLAARELLEANQRVIKAVPVDGPLSPDDVDLITARAAQVEALSAWATAEQRSR